MKYKDIYELMRAYKGSNLLVNKWHIGGRVSEFVDIPNSYKQIVRDENGNEFKYQFFRYRIPATLKTERKIEGYLKKYVESKFQGKLLPIENEEIEKFNQYWDLDFIGLTKSLDFRNSAKIETPKGEVLYFSMEKGKELSDVYEVMFKPLPYTAGVI